jgi:TonB family protein
MPEGDFQGYSPNAHLLVGEMPAPSQIKGRWDVLTGGSFAPVLGIVFLVVLAARGYQIAQTVVNPQDQSIFNIVFLQVPGPGGGGGGGGNNRPEPPPKAQAPGKDQITVPVTKPPEIRPIEKPKDIPPPVQELNIPAQQMAVGVEKLPGVLSDMPNGPDVGSRGMGTGPGSGGGSGSGIGGGSGSGLGPGSGGGTGGGVYQVGNGVTSPIPIYEPRPNYTADAMRAKVQGLVVMDAVVQPDGSVTQVRITRSLDPTFGLDQEAVRTVKTWRFKPGLYRGQPVPVLVSIELSFTLR